MSFKRYQILYNVDKPKQYKANITNGNLIVLPATIVNTSFD